MGCPCKNKPQNSGASVQKTAAPSANGKAGAGKIEKRVIR